KLPSFPVLFLRLVSMGAHVATAESGLAARIAVVDQTQVPAL
ncbi:MAG: hypothetical protein ACI82F_004399, partial [Planctomycetota bacterium]